MPRNPTPLATPFRPTGVSFKPRAAQASDELYEESVKQPIVCQQTVRINPPKSAASTPPRPPNVDISKGRWQKDCGS